MKVNERLPNLICPGTQKAGTTTLFEIFKQHYDICVSEDKESEYFHNNNNKNIEWYKSRYKVDNHKYIMDFSPGYMYRMEIAEKIAKTLGSDIKIIFMLRNPADRAYSQFLMYKTKIEEKSDTFEEAIGLKDLNTEMNGEKQWRWEYVKRGFYSAQITNFIKYFPKENMHFVIFEEFIKDVEGQCKKIFDFLDVDCPENINYNIWVNRSIRFKSDRLGRMNRWSERTGIKRFFFKLPEKPKLFIKNILKKLLLQKGKVEMNGETRKELMNVYYGDIKELEKIIGRDLSVWTKEKVKTNIL